MRRTILSTLTRICWHSGLLRGLNFIADEAQLRRSSTGRPVFPYITRRRFPNFQILTYHRLAENPDPFFPGLSAEVFTRQVAFLAKHYRVVDLGDLVRQLEIQRTVPKN